MKKMRCFKCAAVLDPTLPQYSGKKVADAAKELASDHASKDGCGWPAANLKKVELAIS